jgi:hypothetical protein
MSRNTIAMSGRMETFKAAQLPTIRVMMRTM